MGQFTSIQRQHHLKSGKLHQLRTLCGPIHSIAQRRGRAQEDQRWAVSHCFRMDWGILAQYNEIIQDQEFAWGMIDIKDNFFRSSNTPFSLLFIIAPCSTPILEVMVGWLGWWFPQSVRFPAPPFLPSPAADPHPHWGCFETRSISLLLPFHTYTTW